VTAPPPRQRSRVRARRLRRYERAAIQVPADVARRFQVLPPQGFCTGCDWRDKGSGAITQVEGEAAGHHLATGHQTRAVTVQQAIYAVPAEVSAGA